MDVQYYGEANARSGPAAAIATDGVFLAYALGQQPYVEVAYVNNLDAAPVRLVSHLQERPITALALGQGVLGTSDPAPRGQNGARSHTILFSASKDAVVAWNLAAVYEAVSEGHAMAAPIQMMSGQGFVDALAYSAPLAYLAVCAGNAVDVFDVTTFRNILRLEGHAAPVLAATFCDPQHHLLATAGEDRTFKLWDVQEGVAVYQSSILTASPLTSLAVDPSFPRLAVGAADGVVRFFDMSSLPACRGLQTVNVGRQLQRALGTAAAAAKVVDAGGPKVVSSLPAWKQQMQQQQQQLEAAGMTGDDGDDDDDNTGSFCTTTHSVLQLYYSPITAMAAAAEEDDDAFGDGLEGGRTLGFLDGAPRLLVGTPQALVVLDTQSYDLLDTYLLGERPSSGPFGAAAGGGAGIPAARHKSGEGASTSAGGAAGAVAAAMARRQAQQQQQLRGLPEAAPSALYAFAPAPDDSCVYCCAAGMQTASVAVLRAWPLQDPEPPPPAGAAAQVSTWPGPGADMDAAAQGLASVALTDPGPTTTLQGPVAAPAVSVFQTQPLPQDSPLRACAPRPRSPSPLGPSGTKAAPGGSLARGAAAAAAGRGVPAKAGTARPAAAPKPLVNQPVTFHRKVKSSGYGFVQPQVKMGRAPAAPVKVSKSAAVSQVAKHMMEARQYPIDCEPLTQPQPKNCMPGNEPVHQGPIVGIAYSSDASRLLTASSNKTARVLKLPLSRYGGEGTDLVAHNAPLHGADWSHDGTMVLTASADRTARLWNAACAQPLLTFSHTEQQPPRVPSAVPPTAAAKAANPPLPHEVRAARFVYLDQFVALACGSKLHLYRYKLCEDATDDIERLRNKHTYKLAASYTSSAQAIHGFSTVNSFLSPLAVVIGSSKAIELVDLSVMRAVAAMPDAHARPMHSVVQTANSLFVSHPREAYELFATAAPDNTAKLWDVRTQRCVRTFAGHKNSQIAVGLAFSPCLRYVAVGSEDKVVYMYDVRQGVVAHRIRGTHSDAVTGIAFNPLHPQMATACLDGRVHFYSDAV